MTKEEFKDYYNGRVQFIVQEQISKYQEGLITLSQMIAELQKIDRIDTLFRECFRFIHQCKG